jgi:antibiotic biosynthesis monooxygenase (ABM) superfamily enzyme
VTWESALPADAAGPVTTVTRRVRPGHEAAYEQVLAGISAAAAALLGLLGTGGLPPHPGGQDLK